MRLKEATFTVNVERGTVRMVITERRWGTVRHRTQHTFSRAMFERALRMAELTVPWKDVLK